MLVRADLTAQIQRAGDLRGRRVNPSAVGAPNDYVVRTLLALRWLSVICV